MTKPTPALLAQLATISGPRGLTTDADALAPWLTDWRGTTHGRAAALISPASTAEVQAVVRCVAAAGARLTVQGGNSGMVAGATPDDSGDALILSLRRMNRIRSVDAAAQTLTADAGVILAHAHEAAAAAGCRFPLTLGGKGSATLGGLVSTNAGGTQVLRHGTMRALTLGLEVVLADGTLLDALQPLAKDNRGPDPKHVFIGGEGAFGIVTGVTLKLVPAVQSRAVAWATLPDPETALRLLRHCDAALGDGLEGFELVPDAALAHVLTHIPGTRPPVATRGVWHVLLEVVALTRAAQPAAALEGALAGAAQAGLISDATLAASEAQAEAFWKIRDSISEAERAEGPAIQHDVSVPVAAMPDFIRSAPEAVAAALPGAITLSFGHLGDGNVHCHVRPPEGEDGRAWLARHGTAASAIIYDRAMALGGSISAEHGIGRTKRRLLGQVGDPARLQILRALKAALDPAGTLNPGVLIPD